MDRILELGRCGGLAIQRGREREKEKRGNGYKRLGHERLKLE
jgi:hypothetical protein